MRATARGPRRVTVAARIATSNREHFLLRAVIRTMTEDFELEGEESALEIEWLPETYLKGQSHAYRVAPDRGALRIGETLVPLNAIRGVSFFDEGPDTDAQGHPLQTPGLWNIVLQMHGPSLVLLPPYRGRRHGIVKIARALAKRLGFTLWEE